MEIPLRHRQLVVAVGGITRDFHESAKQVNGFSVFLILDPQIREFDQRLRKIWIRAKRLLKQLLGPCVVSLPFFNKADIEKARCVVRIALESLLKIFQGLIEPSQMPIGEAHESI